MDTKEYINTLLKVFDQLDDQIAYLKLDRSKNTIKYIQQNRTGSKIITASSLYYDFTHSGFIRYSTIRKNKEVLSKLCNYNNEVIFPSKTNYGLEFKVYNIDGELIYHQFVNFYDKTHWYQKLWLSRKFPELILNDK